MFLCFAEQGNFEFWLIEGGSFAAMLTFTTDGRELRRIDPKNLI